MNDHQEPDGRQALTGLKVVDLSRVLAGPYATQMLGDHGAEVIKVEAPAGDMTRDWGPPFRDGLSAYFSGLNRNKKHIALDLSQPEGQEILRTLVSGADVVIENFKPGTMERWGLGADTLLERFPSLIYCRISGFGQTGPMGGMPGYDAVVQAYSGIMHMNGEPGRGPVKVAMPVVDLTTGMLAFSGILLALHERDTSGRGQVVDLALLDSAISLLHPAAANYFMDGGTPPRLGTGHPNVAPYETFESAEGDLLFIGGGNDRQFRALCDYLGAPELAADPRFADNQSRVRHRSELSAEISRLMSTVDLAEASAQMLAHGVPASRVRPFPEVAQDPQVRHREMIVELDGYTGLGIPIKLERTPGKVATPPRRIGADTVEVLRAHGYDEETVKRLLADGVADDGSAPGCP
jgi:crotonobetainyl-CoA:carnitine CoA-transferase CaiB-like acyl-CoA transferase